VEGRFESGSSDFEVFPGRRLAEALPAIVGIEQP
jgi:hypothetical protein